MPDGLTHSRATTLLLVSSVPVMLARGMAWGDVSGVAFGVLLQFIVGPDLDVNIGNYGSHIIRTIVGVLFHPIAGEWCAKAWRTFWYPLSWLIPHRSFWSHSPMGTLVRCIYICLPLSLVLYLCGVPFPPIISVSWWGDFPVVLPTLSGYFIFLGLLSGDVLHILMDLTIKGNKKERFSHE